MLKWDFYVYGVTVSCAKGWERVATREHNRSNMTAVLQSSKDKAGNFVGTDFSTVQ